MNRKNILKLKHLVAAMLICGCFCLTKANAQCSYGAIMIVCESSSGITGNTCCGWWPMSCHNGGAVPGFGTDGTATINPTLGLGPTCGGGTTATGIDAGFTATCGYNMSGTTCGTPWGPTPSTGSYTAYPCIGTCGE
jgi:hypothetical protein